MIRTLKIEEAVVYVDHGVLHVLSGDIDYKKEENYHSGLSFEYSNGGQEIIVEGYKKRVVKFYENIFEDGEFENGKDFDYYCNNLVGFLEKVKIKKKFKFSWKKFKFEVSKQTRFVECRNITGEKFEYKQHLLSTTLYKSNNWIIKIV